MQTEREYLTEISNLLESIQRCPDEDRKKVMRRTLHGRLYTKMRVYGFGSIDQIRRSIKCMDEGKPDPSRNQRCEYVNRAIEKWKQIAHDMEMEMGRATRPGKTLEPSKDRSPDPFNWRSGKDMDKEGPDVDDKEIGAKKDKDDYDLDYE